MNRLEKIEKALEECADSLEAELKARYYYNNEIHPAMKHDFDREMEVVYQSKKALADLKAYRERMESEGLKELIAATIFEETSDWRWEEIKSSALDEGIPVILRRAYKNKIDIAYRKAQAAINVILEKEDV